MSAEKPSPADPEGKPADNLVETPTRDGEKGVRDGADYSGAVAKTSPEEIKLVRKLDWRIMPTLWSMYFLNYVSTEQNPGQRSSLTVVARTSSIEMLSRRRGSTGWRTTSASKARSTTPASPSSSSGTILSPP